MLDVYDGGNAKRPYGKASCAHGGSSTSRPAGETERSQVRQGFRIT